MICEIFQYACATKTNGNLDCSYYETFTRKNFSGILQGYRNGRVSLSCVCNTITADDITQYVYAIVH